MGSEKKNTPSKSGGRAARTQSGKGKSDSASKHLSKGKASERQGSSAPFVLVIMVLITVILFLTLGKTDKSSISVADKEQNERTIEIIQPKLQQEEAEKNPDKNSKETKNKIEDKSAQKNQREEQAAKQAKEKKYSNVSLWFFHFNEKTEKLSLVPVRRRIEGAPTLKEAMRELLAGPTAAESGKDYLTALPKGLRIGNIKIANKTAEIDFSEALGYGASGTILMNRIDQIVYTATQFDDVDGVIITINGKRRSTLGSDGLSIQGPLHRKN